MANAPTKLRVRSYNVGFGDCFLLTFSYGAGGKDRNVLIDFGSTKLSGFSPEGGLVTIAEKIKADCGGKLDMVVATHRHSDHISGFDGTSGETIRALKPDVVLQPWTEDPALDPEARAPGGGGGGGGRGVRERALVSRLSDMHALAAALRAEVPRLRSAAEVPRTLADQIEFLGDTNIKNEGAVRNLMTMGEKQIYARFGTKLAVSKLLPGVKIDVLGPPTLEQAPAIADQARVDADEFWHLAARRAGALAHSRGGSGEKIFPHAPTTRSSDQQEARWVIPQIDRMRAEEMLAIVRSMDDVLNNTSLILVFAVGDDELLFPGDAQIENWRYALRENPDAAAIRARLARVRFYKVGHHGSLNATPKTLWNAFEHLGSAGAPGRLQTMVSTAAGKHGSVKRGTEVPRAPLIDALEAKSELHNTQKLRSKKTFWNDVDVTF
jgi:hypothetical protein